MKSSLVLTLLFLVALTKSLSANDGVRKSFSILSSSSSESEPNDSELFKEDLSAYLHEYSRREGPHKNADSVQEMYNISEEKLFDNSPEGHHKHSIYVKPSNSNEDGNWDRTKNVYVYKQPHQVIRPKSRSVVINSKPIYVRPPPLVVHQPASKPCNPVINYKPPSIKVRPVIVKSKKEKDHSWEYSLKNSQSWEHDDSSISHEYKINYKNHHHVQWSHSSSASDEKPQKPIWNYDKNDPYGPSNWGKIAAICDGNRQSPIALYTHKARSARDAEPLKIEGLDWEPKSLIYENDADSFNLKFNYPKGKKVKISGGPLKIPYILDGVHWHWGNNDQAGSEHTLDSKRYSAELHLVFFNSNYESISEAIKTPKGLAVLGILYELDDYADNPWAAYAKKVIDIKTTYKETRNVFPLRELVQDDDFNILTYKGSLTNPDCNENVTWMVSTKPLPISSSDLAEMRRLKDLRGLPLVKNFRPLQNRNGRVITEYN